MSETAQSPAADALKQAADGLLFQSETDAPLEPFFWPDSSTGTPTPLLLRRAAAVPADAPIKSVRVETFFRPATTQEEWHNEEEKAQVQRFKDLVKTLKETLDNVNACTL